MDGSNEDHEQGVVRFQNTVMALLGYSQMGSERLFQVEDSIDSLKADLSTSLKQQVPKKGHNGVLEPNHALLMVLVRAVHVDVGL
ncbi:hypothetical protein EC957_012381 [Mortierella hygrophila]|uniref:Uncharacterized protein n=1 Tax=Mortierella hygrophila TaxID=979708 RepID=A0A9P6EV76_9FUNG|nr:hypothetical protein EC957_012381 [Mortierella hygrophila]